MAIYRRDIRQVVKTPEEKLTDLLRMCSRKKLQQFIIDYAKGQPGIHFHTYYRNRPTMMEELKKGHHPI